jgi:hypothetical protein
MGLCGAQGLPFFGHRVFKPFGVIYLAYEAGKGFRNRMRAHRKHFGLELTPLPFAVLTKPIDLWSDALNTQALIDEMLWIVDRKFGGVRLGAFVIDTHNAATPGASEVNSEDVSKIRQRYYTMMRALDAGCWIIGHKNAAGKHRGNEQLYNNIETAIDISRKIEYVDKTAYPMKDADGRVLRSARIIKQREGVDGDGWDFVLGSVDVGISRYGKPRTSCVALPAATGEAAGTEGEAKPKGLKLTNQESVILTALKDALAEQGVAPPPELKLPRAIRTVLNIHHWYDAYRAKAADANDSAVKQAMKRASEKLLTLRVIGRVNPWVWLTGRAVHGVIEGRPAGASHEPPAWATEQIPLGDFPEK